MADIFFPSCKVSAGYPEASASMQEYLARHLKAFKTGCCRITHDSLIRGDRAIVICNNCAAILGETALQIPLKYVWEIIDEDPDFPFPDYKGERVSVQDCWLAVERRSVQDSIRSILKKMNLVPVELKETFDKTRFCGATLHSPCTESNAKLAPKRYVENGGYMFTPMSPEEQRTCYMTHCSHMKTEKVICYCMSCVNAIKIGRKLGIHLLELVFPD